VADNNNNNNNNNNLIFELPRDYVPRVKNNILRTATHFKISEKWRSIKWKITTFSGCTPICRPL